MIRRSIRTRIFQKGYKMLMFEVDKYACGAKIFIETGFFRGSTTLNALHKFDKVYSCDINKKFVDRGHRVFKGPIEEGQLLVKHQKSSDFLRQIIEQLDERAVFYLDAHDIFYNGTESDLYTLGDGCPLLEELEIISSHHIKDHTIIVDDLRMFDISESIPKIQTGENWASASNTTIQEIQQRLLEINPDYSMSLDQGERINAKVMYPGQSEPQFWMDVLIASPCSPNSDSGEGA